MNSKYLVDDLIRYEWLAIAIIIEPNSFFTKFNYTHRNGRNKISHDPFYGVHRYTPDAKKSKYMINAKGIKITTHLLKPLPPPREPIFLHPFPIVSGKPPVLSLDGKIIRRGPGLHAHTIQVGFYPRVTTITMYPNRNVALQNNAFFMCIIRSFFQLKMQMVLNKIMKSYVAKCL